MKYNKVWIWIIGVLGITACADSGDYAETQQVKTHVVNVAVMMEKSDLIRWKRTAAWALDNIAKAQQGLTDRVELRLTFHNTDDVDIDDRMQQLAKDTTVHAIVGPTTSDRAIQMAATLNGRKAWNKPMITPSATQVEYQRKFANTAFVWNMAESDIAEIEVLMSKLSISGNNKVELLAADDGNDESRNAYAEWFGFIAEEYGLQVERVCLYKSADDVRKYVRQLCGWNSDVSSNYLIFNPSSSDIVAAFDDEVGRMKAENTGKYFYTPLIFCSDAFVSDQAASIATNAQYQGVDLYASPESGFHQAYRQHFGEDLVNGEAQFYDALCLVAYAATFAHATSTTLNEAIRSVVDGKDGKGGSWLPADMHGNFQQLQAGRTPDIDGVSSKWNFDEQTHSSVTGSTFRLWRLNEKEFVTTEYISTDGSKRTSSSKNIWDWTASVLQTFGTTDKALTYPALRDRWALLIAASTGWSNYRFQADVFAMYQILRQHGYDDDHIVLICEDDVAGNSKNPEPGVLRVSDTGANLYDSSAIDYRLSSLTPADIGDILQGKRSARLSQVINSASTDNVFIFWSSHGSLGSLDFGGSQVMTYEQMKNILANTHHRKMLVAVEACYSGGLGQHCEGLPGTLFITAANPWETSHAAMWNERLGVYRSNGFTRGFQEAIDDNSAISLRDLYYMLARTTSGSHVKVYNASQYGNVYDNSISEYLGAK